MPHHQDAGAAVTARRRRRAFTLLELIVVVIILSVLAAIAGVAYNKFVSDARETAAFANAKQIDKAVTAKSARDDLTPSEVVAAGIASDEGLQAYLRVTGGQVSTTPGRWGTPTAYVWRWTPPPHRTYLRWP